MSIKYFIYATAFASSLNVFVIQASDLKELPDTKVRVWNISLDELDEACNKADHTLKNPEEIFELRYTYGLGNELESFFERLDKMCLPENRELSVDQVQVIKGLYTEKILLKKELIEQVNGEDGYRCSNLVALELGEMWKLNAGKSPAEKKDAVISAIQEKYQLQNGKNAANWLLDCFFGN